MNIKKQIPQVLINYCKHLPESILANLVYDFPGKKIKVIGVTGTDGKTTTVNMIYSILKNAGIKVSMISTINAVVAGKTYDTGFHVTNPDQFIIQKLLKMAVDNHDEFMILETTSHGLDQFRTWGIDFDIGVITNITHEHLDYHHTMKRYVESKAKLISKSKWAVLNIDDPNFETLAKKTKAKIISFGLKVSADFNPKRFPLKLKMFGDYNLYNALAAAATCTILGVDSNTIKTTLSNFSSLEGRMEEVKNTRGIKIIVDFAHTPNGLEQALKSLRLETKKRLISVFGAAAERDQAKRPIMGKIASDLSDIIILTNEDPRFEDESQIIEDINTGIDKSKFMEGKNLFKIKDRQEAIEQAINLARKGDIVGVFGKGHEKSMNIKGVETPWSDQKYVTLALNNAR